MYLGFEKFKELAGKQSIVSNYFATIADLDTPVSIYSKLRKASGDAFLFESVIGGENIGRYSFIGYKALEKLELKDGDAYDYLDKNIARFSNTSEQLPFFHQGYVGFFSFESIESIEPSLKMQESDCLQHYSLLLGSFVVFDHVTNKFYIVSNTIIEDGVDLQELYDKSCAEIEAIKDLIREKNSLDRLEIDESREFEMDFRSNTGEEEYKAMVVKAKEHIHEGDIFQVVPSHKLRKEVKLDPLKIYRILRTVNPSPYLFIFNVNPSQGKSFSLVGSSPEMLVKSDGKQAEIRPIAGTVKRGKTEEEDKLLAEKLLSDEKEIAEHVMLIDLARNDLGRVCNSVKVAKQMFIEKYSHVLHIVSSVIGDLKEGISAANLLRASFPAGTLSGAPKVEAIKIIAELEKEARGPYGGTIGYFGLDGMVDSAIMIRTLLVTDDYVQIQAGGGVVADSDPASELQETYNKAGALVKVIGLARDK